MYQPTKRKYIDADKNPQKILYVVDVTTNSIPKNLQPIETKI